MSLVVKREKQIPDELVGDNDALYPQTCKDFLGVATILEALAHSDHAANHVLGYCGYFSGEFVI